MSVADQINRIKTNIASTYTAAQAKGATMPQTQNSDNLATCVQSITTGGGGSATLFGLTMPQIAGYVAEDGSIQYESPVKAPDFSGVKIIGVQNGRAALFGRFWGFDFEEGTEITFPDLLTINGLEEAFYNTSNLVKVTFNSATSIVDLKSSFRDSNQLVEANFPELTSCLSYGFQYTFANCSNLTTFNVPKLASVSTNSMFGCFVNCTALTTISFPALTTVLEDSFGSTYSYAFSGCTKLLEIHFRADAQTAIEATTGYADKWGATNATIYFDL